MYPVKLNNVCFGVTDCFYIVQHPYRFEMKTHTVYCFIVTQYYIATNGPHNLHAVCQSTHIKIFLPYCSLSPEFSSLDTPACWQITICLFGQVK